MSASHGRVKRLHAEFRGDEAVEIDMLEVILRMGEISRSRIECDTRLVRLALKALQNAMTAYCKKTGQRYPGYMTMMKYLDDTEDPGQGRVINLPSAAGSRGEG
jgi:transcription initiation factor IIE alpha subunit